MAMIAEKKRRHIRKQRHTRNRQPVPDRSIILLLLLSQSSMYRNPSVHLFTLSFFFLFFFSFVKDPITFGTHLLRSSSPVKHEHELENLGTSIPWIGDIILGAFFVTCVRYYCWMHMTGLSIVCICSNMLEHTYIHTNKNKVRE